MLKTKRLILRDFKNDDLEDFYDIFSRQEVVEYLPLKPLSFTKAKEKLNKIIKELSGIDQKSSKCILAIEHKEQQKVIGWVGSGPIPFEQSKIEIFYALHSDYWQQGFAYEAAHEVLKYLTDEKKLKNIYALVDKKNDGSIKILKKMNFYFHKKIKIKEEGYNFFDGLNLYKLKN